jgi:O-antigen ligase
LASLYNQSVKTLLKNIGITPGKKSLVFFISLVAVTIPASHVYNSFAVICFVLFSILAASKHHIKPARAFLIPVALYVLMALSLLWSPLPKATATALGKEAALLFIPLAFIFNRPLPPKSINAILKNFSLAMCAFAIFLIGRAFIRYIIEGNPAVFFNNELASQSISVYLATFFSLALFVFLVKERQTFWGYAATAFLLVMVMLLSRRAIIVTDLFIIAAYYIITPGFTKKQRALLISGFFAIGAVFIGFGNLSGQKFPTGKKLRAEQKHTIGFSEAWNKETFTPNDGFTGPSFRMYRTRVLLEMSQEKGFVFTGAGLNASGAKVKEIAHKDNTTHIGWGNTPYSDLNFHNQYMEIYADLGIFGLALVLLMVAYSLVKAVKNKYFIHFAFAVLMISLFLTESFLWRQKGVVFFTLFYCLFNDYRPSRPLK